jgi:hypothetical protein
MMVFEEAKAQRIEELARHIKDRYREEGIIRFDWVAAMGNAIIGGK